MKSIEYIEDHKDRAVDALLWQYRRAPRIVALVRSLAGAVQTVEDTAYEFLTGTVLSEATGAILDQWGKIVGERRRGLDDDDYRRFIEARILANLSEGTTDRLIEIFAKIAGPGDARFFGLYPAGFALAIKRSTPLSDRLRSRIRSFMESVKPAGVAMTLIEGTDSAYQYDSGPGLGVGEFSRIL